MFGIMSTPISSGTASQQNTIHTVYTLCDDNQKVHYLLPSDRLLCSVFTHFFIQCPLLLKCWFFVSVLFLFTLLLKCWFCFSVLSSLGSLAQVIKLCSSFVFGVCLFFWVFVLVLLCSVLCLLAFWLHLICLGLLVFYLCLLYLLFCFCLWPNCLLFVSCYLLFCFRCVLEVVLFGHTIPAIYMTQHVLLVTHTILTICTIQPSHFALKVFFSYTWSTCPLGYTILAIFYHTSILFALKVFFLDMLS
jgi:hypothetical protein